MVSIHLDGYWITRAHNLPLARKRGCSRADFVRDAAVRAAEDVLMENRSSA